MNQRETKSRDKPRDIQQHFRKLSSPIVAAGLVFIVLLILPDVVPFELWDRLAVQRPMGLFPVTLFLILVYSLLRAWRAAREERWVLDSMHRGALCPTDLAKEHVSVLERIQVWLKHLEKLPVEAIQSSFIGRLRELLQRQLKSGHVHNLYRDMRELAERDSSKRDDGLSFVRTAAWLIPLSGFAAIAYHVAMAVKDAEGLHFASLHSKAHLQGAGDIALLTVILSSIAFSLPFPINAAKRRLSGRIDALIDDLISMQLQEVRDASEADPSELIDELAKRLVDVFERNTRVQTELWRQSMETAERHWEISVGMAGDQVQAALTQAIDHALERHAAEVARIQREGGEAIDQRWRQWQGALSDNARVMVAQQKALIQQGELLAAATERSEELAVLRRALDQNLIAVGQTLESMGVSNELASAIRTLGRAVEYLAERQMALAPALHVTNHADVPLRTRAAA